LNQIVYKGVGVVNYHSLDCILFLINKISFSI